MILWWEGLWKKMMYSVEKFNKICKCLYRCGGQALDGQQSINFRGMQKCSVSLLLCSTYVMEIVKKAGEKKAL